MSTSKKPDEQRPQASSGRGRPAPQTVSSQAKARSASSGARPAGARPAAARGGNPTLVRPAPKAKVRKARLMVSKVDIWSVLKLAFLLSVALGVVTVVATVVLWAIFDVAGVLDQINNFLATIMGEGKKFDVKDYVSMGNVTSFAVIIAVVNVILLTVLAMVAAVIYNLSSSLVGGVTVTLTDD